MIEIIITGFNHHDDRLAFEAPVPDAALPRAIALAGAPSDPNDWDAIYELTEADARAIVGEVPPGLAYTLEAVSCWR